MRQGCSQELLHSSWLIDVSKTSISKCCVIGPLACCMHRMQRAAQNRYCIESRAGFWMTRWTWPDHKANPSSQKIYILEDLEQWIIRKTGWYIWYYCSQLPRVLFGTQNQCSSSPVFQTITTQENPHTISLEESSIRRTHSTVSSVYAGETY